MMPAFLPTLEPRVIDYTDDSSSADTEFAVGSSGATVLYVVNADVANVAVVGASYSDMGHDAIIPIGNAAGSGTVIPPATGMFLALPVTGTNPGTIFVSAAGVSGTGSVYVTPGTFL